MILTPRLRIREWRASDRAPFVLMNADPRVQRYFPSLWTEADTDAVLARNVSHFADHGFGHWAVELTNTSQFIGAIGLAVPRFEAHFTPCVEIAWRLAAEHWNQGLATEGAAAVLHHGFSVLALPEIVAFTVADNSPSRRVMEKLGMTRNPDEDFDHPRLPEGHALRRHVLYRKRP